MGATARTLGLHDAIDRLMMRRAVLHEPTDRSTTRTATAADDRALGRGVGYSAPRRAGASQAVVPGNDAMPPSDDDTDPTSSQTTAAPDDESSQKRSSAEALTDPGPRDRVKTVRGLGEAPAALNYKPPGDYSAEELSAMVDAYARAPRQFPPVKTAFSNGLRAAAYSGQPHAVHGGVDTLPPDDGVIVTIPEEITQPPARRPQDYTTVVLPPIPTGFARREARIVIALLAALVLVVGIGFVMKLELQATDVAPAKSSTATPSATTATTAPMETSSSAPSAVAVATNAPELPSAEPSASSASPTTIRPSASSRPRISAPRPPAPSNNDAPGAALPSPWVQHI
jgi:hypothetical protein